MEKFFATCPRGLEQLLAEELQQLKAENIHAVGGGVEFRGDFPLCYRANLESRIAPQASLHQVLMSCFPAGTLTGAPKIRAMEIIDELEGSRRGFYGGTVVHLDFAGNLDSCIGIRSVVIKGQKAYVQAGAGIVADSQPAAEQQECLNKAKAVLKAVAQGRNQA